MESADRSPGGVRWRRVVLTPRRLELWTTPGRAGAAAARILYQPRRRTGVAGAALTRLLPARSVRALPARDVAVVAEHVAALAGVRFDAAAALHARESGRWLFALTNADGSGIVVKVGDVGDEGLEREAATLTALGPRVAALELPRLRWQGVDDGRFAIATDLLRRRPARTEADLEDARAAACALAATARGFVVHGDLAPWNIVPTNGGIALVDWEDSRFEEDPLYDLAHYVTRAGALLHAWHPDGAVAHLTQPGSAGWRYLAEIDLDPEQASQHVERYLRRAGSQNSSAPLRRYEAAMTEALESHSARRR